MATTPTKLDILGSWALTKEALIGRKVRKFLNFNSVSEEQLDDAKPWAIRKCINLTNMRFSCKMKSYFHPILIHLVSVI